MLNKIIYTILGIGLALIFFPRPAQDSNRQASVAGTAIGTDSASVRSSPEMAVNLPAPLLTARAALAYDLDSSAILYSKNLDEKLPVASLTKLVTALVAVKTKDLNQVVLVPREAQGVVGSTIGLVAGEKIKADDLLSAMLISSSNDATLALAYFVAGDEEKFVKLMNLEAKNLGLVATNFSNPVGWDFGENYSNTLDLMKIVKEFLNNPKLAQTVAIREKIITSTDGKYSHTLRTTNKLLLDDPNVAGIKTGFTSKAQGNLIILINHQGSQIVTLVLGSDNREVDSEKLLDWLFKAYRW